MDVLCLFSKMLFRLRAADSDGLLLGKEEFQIWPYLNKKVGQFNFRVLFFLNLFCRFPYFSLA